MKSGGIRTVPKIEIGKPVWWHHHGAKISILNQSDTQLWLGSKVAKLTISKRSDGSGWTIQWSIQHSPAEYSEGKRHFTDDALAAAFCLNQLTGDFGDWIIEQYGASAAEQQLFIRWDYNLNIPCPGTGHDGDPNISIYVEPEIIEAVARLLGMVT